MRRRQDREHQQHEPERLGIKLLHGVVEAVGPEREQHVQAHAKQGKENDQRQPDKRQAVFRRVEIGPGNQPELPSPDGVTTEHPQGRPQPEQADNKSLPQPGEAGNEFMIPIHRKPLTKFSLVGAWSCACFQYAVGVPAAPSGQRFSNRTREISRRFPQPASSNIGRG